jgi:hypothetical protein
MRRLVLIVTAVVVGLLVLSNGVNLLFPQPGTVLRPACGTGRTMQLMAQAVPSATRLPCVRSLPVGWTIESARVSRGGATFTLNYEVGFGQPPAPGELSLLQPVSVSLTANCPPAVENTRALPVDGGCVAYRTSIPEGGESAIPSFDAGGGLSFVERADLVTLVEQEEGLTLCGAGAPPCEP